MNQNVNIYIPAGKAVFYANFRMKEKDPKNPAIVRTRQVNRSTGSPDRRTAQRIANDMRNSALQGLFETVPKLRDDCPTVGKVIDTYLAATRVATAKVVVRNFLTVVAEGSGLIDDREAARKIRVNSLSAETMQAFRDMTHWPPDHPNRPVRTATTINSIMRSARGIFARRAAELYRGLALPQSAITDWLSVSYLTDKSDKRFRRIPEHILAKLDRRAIVMLRYAAKLGPAVMHWSGPRPAENRPVWAGATTNSHQWVNAYGTYWLMRRCGLRNDECESLRWDWFHRDGDRILLSLVPRPYWQPKGSAGDVPVAADLYALLIEHFGPAKPGEDGFVLKGTASDRYRGANHCVSGWVRKHLRDRTKAAYELRKQWGSEIARKYGIETASKLLRHTDIKTTFSHYFDDLNLGKVEAL